MLKPCEDVKDHDESCTVKCEWLMEHSNSQEYYDITFS